MKMKETVFTQIKEQLLRLNALEGGFYQKKYAGLDIGGIQSQEDFQKLPFTNKEELREAYPLGLQAVPDEEIVRIHSSSGTTGTPIIIPYTKKDVADWALMFKRCYETAGITNLVNILSPEMVLIGGGISRQGERLLAPIRRYVAANCFGGTERPQPVIQAAQLGNEAGIIGAAAL